MPDRFYVSLSATCDEPQLATVLDRMQAATPSLLGIGLDGLTLSFTREDDDGALTGSTESVALPVTPAPAAGPVTSTGPGAPPPDAATPPPIVPDATGGSAS